MTREKPERLDDPLKSDRLPPYALECEQGLLGSILLGPEEGMTAAIGQLRAGAKVFYDLRHQEIYKALLEMYSAGEKIETITLWQKLKDAQKGEAVGGLAYLSSLAEASPSVANIGYYIAPVVEKFKLRRLLAGCTEIAGQVYDCAESGELLAKMDKLLLAISRESGSKAVCLTAREMIHKALDNAQAMHEGTAKGFMTGFKDLDDITGGMKLCDFWIIAGRPSMGKSVLGRQIVTHCCVDQQIPCGVFSMEETDVMYGHNMLHSRARVDNRAAQEHRLAEMDFAKLATAAAQISPTNFEICTKSDLSINELRSIARQMKQRLNCQVFEVDYLQLASSQTRNGEGREREMAQVSNGLKNMAKELDAVVIANCQLNRKGDNPGELPKMEWLRESGQIEADADFIGVLYYPDAKYKESINLYVLKQRYGPRFVDIPLLLMKEFSRFEAGAKSYDQNAEDSRASRPPHRANGSAPRGLFGVVEPED